MSPQYVRFPALLALLSATILACDCPWFSICQDLVDSQSVFVGRLDPITDPPGSGPGDKTGTSTSTVRVIERFRGVAPGIDRLDLDTLAFTSCSVSLEIGVEYLFFARPTDTDGLRVDRCNPPISVSSAATLLDALRKIRDNPDLGIINGWASLELPVHPHGVQRSTLPSIDQMQLIFEGPATRNASISSGRRFSVYAVPVGRYRFRMDDPEYGVFALEPWQSDTVKLPRGPFACADLRLVIRQRQ